MDCESGWEPQTYNFDHWTLEGSMPAVYGNSSVLVAEL